MDVASSSNVKSSQGKPGETEGRNADCESYLDFELPYTPEEHAANTFKYITSAVSPLLTVLIFYLAIASLTSRHYILF
ncbi:unnamed protein product [Strongylus vulgaris]|uniref:Uncharacterized protein n=1 Tax=Strongylus vulgaris TaxID=40348 RepID=A0A3P7LPH2_STRVU|nr:unnamed protein product [Strongylus vulgaris]